MKPLAKIKKIGQEKPLRGRGLLLGFLSFFVIASLPFSAIKKIGFLGNFDANLALFPYLILTLILFARGALKRTFLKPGPEGLILRFLGFFMLLTAVFTLINGLRLSEYGLEAYGTNPFDRSIKTFLVPVFLFVLVLSLTSLAAHISPRQLNRAISAAFLLTLSYTLFQIFSVFFPNQIYDAIRKITEGVYDTGTMTYFEKFGRISGPTAEPAELAKLMVIFFSPWVFFPISGRASWLHIAIVFAATIATQSIVGFVLIIFVTIASIIFSEQKTRVVQPRSVFIILFTSVIILLVGDAFFGKIWDRVATISQDPSALIRYNYNKAAISIISDNIWIGIGWSNEIFLFPNMVSDIGFLWEVQNDIDTGNALTAKSLLLRIFMYSGVPLATSLIVITAYALNRPNQCGSETDQKRTKMAFTLFLVGGIVDGGIVTSFFLWAGPALALGWQIAAPPERPAFWD